RCSAWLDHAVLISVYSGCARGEVGDKAKAWQRACLTKAKRPSLNFSNECGRFDAPPLQPAHGGGVSGSRGLADERQPDGDALPRLLVASHQREKSDCVAERVGAASFIGD